MSREIDGMPVVVEFLCETTEVEPGRIFRPKGESTGSRLGAFNVRGAHLVRDDFAEQRIRAERLDGGGMSDVTVRVANLMPYTVLKILAFQDRHENKDAYDLVFTLFNHGGDPRASGIAARSSPVAKHPLVGEALGLLGARFRSSAEDGPSAYASFLASAEQESEGARLRHEAVATVREFLRGFGESELPVGSG